MAETCDCSNAGTSGVGVVRKTRKRRTQRRTGHCVVSSKSGKLFNCYADESTARRIAHKLKHKFSYERR